MATLRACCYVIALGIYMELILVQLLVMSLDSLIRKFLVEHLGVLMGYHLVHRGIGQISTYSPLGLSPPLKFLVEIIQSLLVLFDFSFHVVLYLPLISLGRNNHNQC